MHWSLAVPNRRRHRLQPLDEQDYGIDLAALASDLADWTRVRVRFVDLTGPPIASTLPHAAGELARCLPHLGVGFRRGTTITIGELPLADIRLLLPRGRPAGFRQPATTVLSKSTRRSPRMSSVTDSAPGRRGVTRWSSRTACDRRVRAWTVVRRPAAPKVASGALPSAREAPRRPRARRRLEHRPFLARASP